MTNTGIFAINATELLGHNILLMEIDSTEDIKKLFNVIARAEDEWHIQIDVHALDDSDLANEIRQAIKDIREQFDVDATALTWVW